jgi:hypothetical protein
VEEFEPSALTGGAPWAKPLIELLVGVITQAVRDYQSQDEDGKDAREWIGDKDATECEPWTFPWVCAHLDMDPDIIRAGIRKYAKQNKVAGFCIKDRE